MPLILLGDAPYPFLETQGILDEFDDIPTYYMGVSSVAGEAYNAHILVGYLQNCLGMDFALLPESDAVGQLSSDLSAMPVYPSDGSIAITDKGVLVKLSELPPSP